MKRRAALVVLVGLVAASAPAAQAARLKTKVPKERTYFVVPDGEGCGLSIDPRRGYQQSQSCGGAMGGLGATPVDMRSLDGVPLTLDVQKPIHGTLVVGSTYAFSYFVPLGAGQSRIEVTLTGTSAGKEVLVGETVTEPYTVSPLAADYEVPFEITPDPALAHLRLDELTMTVALVGTTVAHGHFPTNAASKLTLPLAR